MQTLRPTYRLTIGLPGRSNALLIAQRLGLDPQIIAAAREQINPAELRADKLLDDIRKERNRTSREREKLEKARQHTEKARRELEAELEKIEDQRREVLARARAEGELEVAVLRQNIDSLKAQSPEGPAAAGCPARARGAGPGHGAEEHRGAGGASLCRARPEPPARAPSPLGSASLCAS